MSPKSRLKENRPLPKRWAIKHGAYYYLVPVADKTNWDNKSWFRLGTTLSEAHKKFSERMNTVRTNTVYMIDMLDRFQFEYLPELAHSTQQYYLGALPRIREMFTKTRCEVSEIEPYHAYQMTDYLEQTGSKKVAKQAAECLSSALSFAVRKGIIKRNPLIGQFQKPTTEGRDRAVSDAEFIAFAQSLPRKWQLYVMLKLHTKGRRKGELLRVMHSDLQDDGMHFVNNKRKKDTFIVTWTPELRLIVQEILDLHPTRLGDAPLFFGRKFEPYINEKGKTTGFNSIWQRYMAKAVAAGVCEHFTEHDLRAKAVEHETLQVASVFLRHTTTKVTAKHYRRKPESI